MNLLSKNILSNLFTIKLRKVINGFEIIGNFSSIAKLNNSNMFTLKDACSVFPYLCERAVHSRLASLVNLGYLRKETKGYSLTNIGQNIAMSRENDVKITRLRTNPKENEANVIKFLSEKGMSYRNEIARELKINSTTISDTLQRLVNQQRIQMVSMDRFQRRYYKCPKTFKY